VFLDRDGTIVEEVEFLRTPDELRLIPGAALAVRSLNALGILTCVISNQAGVARGFLEERDLARIHTRLEDELRKDGARVDRIYYCPHHPIEGRAPYVVDCECRKPKPGMLKQAARDFGVALDRSFVVGDRVTDVLAGKAVGATTALVLTGYGRTTVEECRRDGITPDFVSDSIVGAVQWITYRISEERSFHA
jgi:D-glycero-D-manno-heptose 1,7-bisphosphate phosphatase